LATLAERQRLGLPSPTLNTCIDLWLRFLASGAMIDDPLVGPLWKALETGRSDGGRKAVFGPGGPLASQWDLCKP